MKRIIEYGSARFTVITEHLIRCEYSKTKKFLDKGTLFAVCREHNGCPVSVEYGEDTVYIRTDAMELAYWNNGEDGFTAQNLYGLLCGAEWQYGDKNRQNLGGTLSTLDGVEGPVPTDDGILSRDGWFVLDDSAAVPVEDGWLRTNYNRDETDLYIFAYGSDYKKALESLFYVSGAPALPRKYVLGSWYSRWWPYTQQEILDIVEEYDRHDFPLDIMVIDMDWHHHDWTYRNDEACRRHKAVYGYGHAGNNMGWTGYSWNKNLIPDPEALLRELHQRGIYVSLNDHPHDGVRSHEDGYPAFMAAMGLPASSGINLEYDLSSRRYMNAFFDTISTPLERQGVDFWWVDWQQDEVKPWIKGTRMRHLPWMNYCYFHHMEQNNKRGISYSRWGGFGDHKHPIYFSGDTKSTWEGLKFQVAFTARSSNAGLFYWGHDTGGFYGDRNGEMYVRWTQFTGLSACLRVHSQRDAALDRRPWMWGAEAEAAMRRIYHLRARLMPYIYTLAYEGYHRGQPLTAPMYLEHPEREEAYHNDQQYYFGPAIICAPVTSPMENGLAAQQVWVPDGVYYDYFTNEAYGPGQHTIHCPLDRFPLLIRGGFPVPMQPYTARMTSQPLKTLTIRCYPGERGQFVLYEDDGISNDYKDNICLKTVLKYRRRDDGTITVSAAPTGSGYPGMVERRSYVIELMNCSAPAEIINGVEAAVEYADGINRITLPARSIRDAVKVKLRLQEH